MTSFEKKIEKKQMQKYIPAKKKTDSGTRVEIPKLSDFNANFITRMHKQVEKHVYGASEIPDTYIWWAGSAKHSKPKPPTPSKYAAKKIPNVDWDHISGLSETKKDIQDAIEIPYKHKDIFKHYSRPSPKGILLAGPPGCGKTMLGKAAATSIAKIHKKESAASGFLYVKGPEIINCYWGGTEENIRQIFADAKAHKAYYGYPAIVFIDEAETVLRQRGSNIHLDRWVGQFLTEMDGVEDSAAIVILATNAPELLDPAIVRDGRIDRKIFVTRPSEDTAREILTSNFKGVPVVEDPADIIQAMLETIFSPDCKVKNTPLRDLLSGAMLANAVNIAASIAMHKDIETGRPSGVTVTDAIAAIHKIQRQT